MARAARCAQSEEFEKDGHHILRFISGVKITFQETRVNREIRQYPHESIRLPMSRDRSNGGVGEPKPFREKTREKQLSELQGPLTISLPHHKRPPCPVRPALDERVAELGELLVLGFQLLGDLLEEHTLLERIALLAAVLLFDPEVEAWENGGCHI